MSTVEIDESQRDPSQSPTASGKLLTAREFDKGRCVRDFLDEYQRLLSKASQLPIVVTSAWEEAPTATVPFSTLNVITIPELIPGKHHRERVLHGQFCVQPYEDSSVKTVLEDANGRGVRLTIYNVLSSTESRLAIKSCFPLGMRAAIKEPLLEVCVDGTTVVRVDNPADIFLDESCEGDNLFSVSRNVEKAEIIRCEGNCLFFDQDWIGSVSRYSECIDMAVRMIRKHKKMESNHDIFNLVKINRIVMLAYSNRAEARLRLQSYKEAMSDADKALEINSKHVKTLVRKAKAAHGLELFEPACKSLKAALELSPPEQSTLKNVKAITDYFTRGCTGEAPSCSDYVGPVEIRRVDYGFGRRGLFATTQVKAGDFLLASNPLAVARTRDDEVSENIKPRRKKKKRLTWYFRSAEIRFGHSQQIDLITELANRVKTSKRRMAQLYSLGVYGKVEMEIPSMELFRPGSEWVPSGAEKLQVDVPLISEIVRMNSFQKGYDEILRREREMDDGEHSAVGVSSGFWLLPSFANHSCAPSCLTCVIGDTMFFRAARDLEEGEELTIPYFDDLYDTLWHRRFYASMWGFDCTCERCVFEETLHPQICKISKGMHYLVEAVLSEGEESSDEESTDEECSDEETSRRGFNWKAVKELAAVAGKIEAVIHSRKVDSRKSGWIRASFLKAYESKLDLEFMYLDRKSGQMAFKRLNKCKFGSSELKHFNSALSTVSLPSGADYLTGTTFLHPVLGAVNLPTGTSFLSDSPRGRPFTRDLLLAISL